MLALQTSSPVLDLGPVGIFAIATALLATLCLATIFETVSRSILYLATVVYLTVGFFMFHHLLPLPAEAHWQIESFEARWFE